MFAEVKLSIQRIFPLWGSCAKRLGIFKKLNSYTYVINPVFSFYFFFEIAFFSADYIMDPKNWTEK